MRQTSHVAPILVCEECGCSRDLAVSWRGYLIDLDEDGEKSVFFCPACVEREFLPSSDGRPINR